MSSSELFIVQLKKCPQLSLDQLLQMQLPGHFGGMFLPSPSLTRLQIAHLASTAASWRPTFSWLSPKGYSVLQAANAIDTHAANFAGCVYITAGGEICSQYIPTPLLSFDTPLDSCIHALQGKLTNCL